MLALTLFRLKGDRDVEAYREFTRAKLRSGMEAMGSVREFRDLQVVGWMSPSTDDWDLLEVIEITSQSDFEAEHAPGAPGAAVAEEWAEWIADHRVLFCADL